MNNFLADKIMETVGKNLNASKIRYVACNE